MINIINNLGLNDSKLKNNLINLFNKKSNNINNFEFETETETETETGI